MDTGVKKQAVLSRVHLTSSYLCRRPAVGHNIGPAVLVPKLPLCNRKHMHSSFIDIIPRERKACATYRTRPISGAKALSKMRLLSIG